MKVLVLGATGFIGGHIAKAAVEEGWEVWGLSRTKGWKGHIADQPIEWVKGDLEDKQSLNSAVKGVEVVYHAAGYYPTKGNTLSVEDQICYASREIHNVIDACRDNNVGKLIYTSTLTTIGHPAANENRLADESDDYTPGSRSESGYYETKIKMESILLEECKRGFSAVILNPTVVFGPGDVHITAGGLLIAVAKGWGLGWFRGTINIVDVRDVASAHIQAHKKGRIGERYILGGHNIKVKEALSQAAQIAKVRPPIFEIPLWSIDLLGKLKARFPFLPLPANHLQGIRLLQGYNIDKARNELGLDPMPLHTTIQDALIWFEEHGMVYPDSTSPNQ